MATIARESAGIRIEVRPQRLRAKRVLRISGYTFDAFDVITAVLHQDGLRGRGEAAGVYYHHETPEVMLAQIESVRAALSEGIDRMQLLELLPPGGARNALDCALWELEAQRTGRHVRELAGVGKPKPLRCTYTIGANDPAAMAAQARAWPDAVAIKLKLTGVEENAGRVRAVRAARPDVWLMVDANQGFSRDSFKEALPAFVAAQVAVVEQPFPVGREDWLDGLDCPIPIAADESVQDYDDLRNVVGRVRIIN